VIGNSYNISTLFWRKQNSFKTVLKLFCLSFFSFISVVRTAYANEPKTAVKRFTLFYFLFHVLFHKCEQFNYVHVRVLSLAGGRKLLTRNTLDN